MKTKKNYLFPKDLYRYSGESKRRFKDFFVPIEVKFIKALRKAQYYREQGNRFLYWYWELKKRRMSTKTHIQIPTVASIGPGLHISHFGRIIINSKVVLGKNVTLNTGITIGQTNRGKKKGVPSIGNNVWIGSNSVIVGNIHIGDDVFIAPNSFVTTDIPSHSLVIGNPIKIIQRDNATEGYLENTI